MGGGLPAWVCACALAVSSGCYLGVRGGPTMHSSDDIEYESMGWNLSLILGAELTLFDLVRVAFGLDGTATGQAVAGGSVAAVNSGTALDVDVTVWQKQTWTKNVDGCAEMRGGWRVRTGLGIRGGGDSAEGISIKMDGEESPTKMAIDGYRAYDASVEAGFWRHTSNAYVGAGTTVATTDITGGGSIRSYSMYLQLQVAGTGPLKTMNTLFSNYGAIEAQRQQRNWASVDCSSARDPSACERAKRKQVNAWGAKEVDEWERGKRRRAMNKCL